MALKRNISLNCIFQMFLDNGTISIGDVVNSSQEDIMNTILSTIHHYAISKTKDGRYTTYIPDATKPNGRRQIRRKSETELYRSLLEFYGVEEEQKTLTFAELFTEWIQYKKRFIDVKNKKKSLSPSTIRRYERDYENYLITLPLASMAIDKVTTPKLQLMLADMIESNNMTEKCAGNIIGYICQSFAYARRSEYITKDPAETLDKQLLYSLCVYTPPKTDSERVLTVKETVELRKAVLAQEQRHPYYMPNYAIELATLTGMRVGELAALRWSDIDDYFIHIDYSEHRYDYSDKPCELVIAEPKNGKHRLLPLTDDIRTLLDKIKALSLKSEEDFLFVRKDGTRYTAHDISCAIDRRADEAGLKASVHKVRRTLSSELNTILPQKVVADMLGHSERVNERHYNYSTAETNEKADALKAVSSKVINFKLLPTNKKIAESL